MAQDYGRPQPKRHKIAQQVVLDAGQCNGLAGKGATHEVQNAEQLKRKQKDRPVAAAIDRKKGIKIEDENEVQPKPAKKKRSETAADVNGNINQTEAALVGGKLKVRSAEEEREEGRATIGADSHSGKTDMGQVDVTVKGKPIGGKKKKKMNEKAASDMVDNRGKAVMIQDGGEGNVKPGESEKKKKKKKKAKQEKAAAGMIESGASAGEAQDIVEVEVKLTGKMKKRHKSPASNLDDNVQQVKIQDGSQVGAEPVQTRERQTNGKLYMEQERSRVEPSSKRGTVNMKQHAEQEADGDHAVGTDAKVERKQDKKKVMLKDMTKGTSAEQADGDQSRLHGEGKKKRKASAVESAAGGIEEETRRKKKKKTSHHVDHTKRAHDENHVMVDLVDAGSPDCEIVKDVLAVDLVDGKEKRNKKRKKEKKRNTEDNSASRPTVDLVEEDCANDEVEVVDEKGGQSKKRKGTAGRPDGHEARGQLHATVKTTQHLEDGGSSAPSKAAQREREPAGDEEEEQARTWLEDDARTDVKHGFFSKAETEKLVQAIREYAVAHNLDTEDLTWVSNLRSVGSKGAIKAIAHVLPHRRCRAIHEHLARVLHRDRYKGTWTPEEDAMLQQLVHEHGRKFSRISTILGRDRLTCRDRWNLIGLEDRRTGHWSAEETSSLRQALEEYMEGREHQRAEDVVTNYNWLRDGINWRIISEKVGTRNYLQCLERWYKVLCPSMINKGEWAPGDDRRLLRALFERQYAHEWEVDWGSLVDGRSTLHVRKRWQIIIKSVPQWREKEFDEIVQCLVDLYMPELKKGKDSEQHSEDENDDDVQEE